MPATCDLSHNLGMKRLRSILFSILPATRRQVAELKFIFINAKEVIMASQAEVAAGLATASAQLQKIGAESTTTLEKVRVLEDQIANGNVSPELQAAFDDLKVQLQKVDDLVPDAATPNDPETPVDPGAPIDPTTPAEGQ